MPRGKRRLGSNRIENFGDLIRLFQTAANPQWATYRRSTQLGWGGALAFMAAPDTLGLLPLDEIRPSLVQAFFDGIADRPGKCQQSLAVLKQLEKWAIVRELLPRQITLGVRITRPSGGHIPWTDEQVATAETHARPDLARAVTLAANTGQRGSDLVRMCWTDIEVYSGVRGLNVTQIKTGRRVFVPISPELAAAMETWQREPGPFLRRPDGLAWERKDLTQHWTWECRRNPALLEHQRIPLVLHGLRGYACVRLRRAGANEQQISSMVGMSVPMVEKYCRFSVQKENAVAAIHLLSRANKLKSSDGRGT